MKKNFQKIAKTEKPPKYKKQKNPEKKKETHKKKKEKFIPLMLFLSNRAQPRI